MKSLRLALAQVNPTVGDIKGNTRLMISALERAKKKGADIVVFPELCVTGYPPEDLLLKPSFVEENLKALEEIRKAAQGITAIVGFVDRDRDIFNAAAVLHDRRLVHVYHKSHLPNYGVFDEVRYFQTGSACPVFRMGEISFGVTICEDIWYPEGPAHTQALAGAELVVNINASPYHEGRQAVREHTVSTRANESSVAVAYLNTVGFQDEIIFDGGSFIVDETGEVIARAPQFKEDLLVADLDLEGASRTRLLDTRKRKQALEAEKLVTYIDVPIKKKAPSKKKLKAPSIAPLMGPEEEVYSALLLGVKDYMKKNRFSGGLVGLSGGIDSALVATIATDALGKQNVRCVFMPSEYTSKMSREDAKALANNLGVRLTEFPIDDLVSAYRETLKKEFKGTKAGVAEENIQARIRGNLLMALSNKYGHIVLTTGNKSEMSVGYATLYGDMAGGFAVIKDVPKTMAYRLARWRNEQGKGPVIPERILTREPTAELRPNQKDSDSLPPYDVLDPIIRAYIEEEKSQDEIVATLGIKAATVEKVIRLIDSNEYKRRQSPPGIKVTPRAFGKDWRLPITNRFRGRSIKKGKRQKGKKET
jgi:NAD+ synthase (glutamine-hydrolysing)